jgi:hypothetical protein
MNASAERSTRRFLVKVSGQQRLPSFYLWRLDRHVHGGAACGGAITASGSWRFSRQQALERGEGGMLLIVRNSRARQDMASNPFYNRQGAN